MFKRIDEGLSKFFSVVVTPVCSVALLSVIVSISSNGVGGLAPVASRLGATGLVAYILNVGSAILNGQSDQLTAMIMEHDQALIKASGVFSIVALFVIGLAIYLIDRMIYYVGWIFPLDFAFDCDAYGEKHADSRRIGQLYKLLGSVHFPFSDAYGVVSTWLGSQGPGSYGLRRRPHMVARTELSLEWFYYAKGYAIIILLLFALSFAHPLYGIFNREHLAWCVVASLAGMAFCAFLYSHAYRDLVMHDVEHFIWISCYSADDRKSVELECADVEFLRAPRMQGAIDRLLSPLMLKYDPSGLGYLLQLLLRRKRKPKRA
ncbi:MAG TPA: hypothetical protein VGG01_01045 [Xanthobacteraceae bacterium]